MALKRGLNSDLTLYRNALFPRRFNAPGRKRYEAVLGIGGNVGDVPRRFGHLVTALRRDARLTLHATSPMLKNPPFGYVEQADFYNAVIVVSTEMQPMELLDHLMKLEARFGRRRSFANAPRTLDIDIIFFDGRRIESPRLRVPHPDWHNRQSVVIPLAYLGKQ